MLRLVVQRVGDLAGLAGGNGLGEVAKGAFVVGFAGVDAGELAEVGAGFAGDDGIGGGDHQERGVPHGTKVAGVGGGIGGGAVEHSGVVRGEAVGGLAAQPFGPVELQIVCGAGGFAVADIAGEVDERTVGIVLQAVAEAERGGELIDGDALVIPILEPDVVVRRHPGPEGAAGVGGEIGLDEHVHHEAGAAIAGFVVGGEAVVTIGEVEGSAIRADDSGGKHAGVAQGGVGDRAGETGAVAQR